ncbi:MAG: hypothetical protein KGI50_06185 [Patescibacteria group bacterium]|nr:hypothetical protein [Patescibacteria group bacterium]MDE2438975.1 hypothetical protein [Patescibacteria group bacterium]
MTWLTTYPVNDHEIMVKIANDHISTKYTLSVNEVRDLICALTDGIIGATKKTISEKEDRDLGFGILYTETGKMENYPYRLLVEKFYQAPAGVLGIRYVAKLDFEEATKFLKYLPGNLYFRTEEAVLKAAQTLENYDCTVTAFNTDGSAFPKEEYK